MVAPDPGAKGQGRVSLLTYEQARSAAEEVGVPTYMARLSIFQMFLRHPKLARALNDLLGVMLFDGELSVRLRELIIMRVGWSTHSLYEWTQHWQIAKALGVDEEDLLALRDWRASSRFGEADRAVLAATDEMVDDGAISAATWDLLVENVGALGAEPKTPEQGRPDSTEAVSSPADPSSTAASSSTAGAGATPGTDPDREARILLELVGVIGAWRMVSSWLRSLEVPLEPGTEPWPPDGISPANGD